ncbi:MAG: MFS transporter [Deltaproteobacteria bacterium]|nr:MFS transporter [Deltaproteobacteria bacterium]
MSDELKKEHAEQERLSLWQNFKLLNKSRGYRAVNIANFGDGIAYFGLLSLLTLFLEHNVGMSEQASGVATSVFTGIVTVAVFTGAGFAVDWLGVRRGLNLALILILGGRVLIGLAPGAPSATLFAWSGLVVLGLGEAVIQPALYAGAKEYADERTSTMAYALIYAIMNLGIVIEHAASPLLREWFRARENDPHPSAGGITGVYWVLSGVTTLMLLSNLLTFTKKVEREDRVASDSPRPAERSSRIAALLDPRFLFFIFVLLPVRTLFAHQWLTMPSYVTRCFPKAVGQRYEWISGLNPLVVTIGVPAIAAMTRGVNVIKMMIIGTSISALATLLLCTEPNLTLLVAYVLIFSLGEAVWSSRFLEYVAELAPTGQVGAYMGIATLPWFLAKTTTGFYSGAMIAHYLPKDGAQQPATMWTIYFAMAIISPIGLIIARKWIARGTPTPGEARA